MVGRSPGVSFISPLVAKVGGATETGGTNYPADACHLVVVPHSRILFWAGFEFLHKQVIWEIIPGKTNKEVRE